MASINIGEEIRRELRRQGRTWYASRPCGANEWLADRIHVHPRTVQKIFLKPSIDTRQLLAISQALGVDFFRLYSLTIARNPCNSPC